MTTREKSSCSPWARQGQRSGGFTLVELLVVMAVALLLMRVAVPSLRAWSLKRAVQQAAETLVADLRLARSEAIKRATTVAVCASSDGRSCAASDGGWAEGWLVFVDRNGNRVVDGSDELLRVQARWEAVATLAGLSPATDKRIFTYQPSGSAKVASQTLWVKAGEGAAADSARLVCVSNQGRPSLRPAGTLECN